MKRRLGITVGTLALGLGLSVPTASGANTLYAVASGGAGSGSCAQTAPCTFDFALSALSTGDTLMLFPGTYQIPAGTASCSNSNPGFDLKNATVEGMPGLPAPTLNEGPLCGTFQVDTGAILRHVVGSEDPTAASSGAPAFTATGGGVIDGVRDTNGVPVYVSGLGTVENSFAAGIVFVDTGGKAINDTAGEVIVEGYQQASAGGAHNASATVINTIAQEFRAFSVNVDSQNVPPTTTAVMTLSHYTGMHFTTPPGPFNPATAPGTINQDSQVPAPSLASDHLHELALSSTIDAGIVVQGGPTDDFDGGIRNNGSAPDIGADEYGTGLPTLSTLAATNVTSTSATLNGTINTNQVDNPTVRFLHGPGVSLSSQTPAHDIPAGVSDVPVSATVTGLTPDTTYSFVLASGAQQALVVTFHTAKRPPVNPFKGVAFEQTSASVSSKRTLSLKLYCPSSTIGFCKGTLTLTSGKTKLSSAGFLSNHGNLFTLKLTLSKSGFALLMKKRSLNATATSVAHDANGNAKTTSASVKLKAPPKPKHKPTHKKKKKH